MSDAKLLEIDARRFTAGGFFYDLMLEGLCQSNPCTGGMAVSAATLSGALMLAGELIMVIVCCCATGAACASRRTRERDADRPTSEECAPLDPAE